VGSRESTGVRFWYTVITRKEFPLDMKTGIHPAYNEVNVICACGHTFKTRSTHKGDIRVEICSNCHPFFTGKQKLMDTAGRVDKFEKKYQKLRGKKAQPVA
jgi:large subunit ribosomal protein L31